MSGNIKLCVNCVCTDSVSVLYCIYIFSVCILFYLYFQCLYYIVFIFSVSVLYCIYILSVCIVFIFSVSVLYCIYIFSVSIVFTFSVYVYYIIFIYFDHFQVDLYSMKSLCCLLLLSISELVLSNEELCRYAYQYNIEKLRVLCDEIAGCK